LELKVQVGIRTWWERDEAPQGLIII
jgi:hypothetical protein